MISIVLFLITHSTTHILRIRVLLLISSINLDKPGTAEREMNNNFEDCNKMSIRGFKCRKNITTVIRSLNNIECLKDS
jgi:hypothetical protein